MNFSGSILGYDPGGNGSHGVALCRFDDGEVTEIQIGTYANSEQVLSYAEGITDLKAVGVDTLTCWCTGQSGWRPADLLLRRKYKPVLNSVASPNSLFGSMGLNGMSVLLGLRSIHPNLIVSETHPKVLYFALSGKKYDYANDHIEMDSFLSSLLKKEIRTKNDHEWDAAISVFATVKGLTGEWSTDLHQEGITGSGRLIKPCGDTVYWWPSDS